MNTAWTQRPRKDCLQLTPGVALSDAALEHLSQLPESDQIVWRAAAVQALTPLRQYAFVLMLECFENEPGTDGELSPSEARMIEFVRAFDCLPAEDRDDLTAYCEAVLRTGRSH